MSLLATTERMKPQIRQAKVEDLDALLALEEACFETDRLSIRSFKHYLKSTKSMMLVACNSTTLLGYGLVLMRKGTRLSRLYSIAVSQQTRGLGVGKLLLSHLEQAAMQADKLFMRLEVACNNHRAIRLYEEAGYRSFGLYENYYGD